MPLPPFDVLQPQSMDEACKLLSLYKPGEAAILAGGTDILVDIRIPLIPEHLPRCKGCDPQTGKPQKAVENPPKFMIALSRIPGLSGIEKLGNGDIAIGAMTTIIDIASSELVRNEMTALAEGADQLGSPLVRNRGTIGGNICNARPAADSLVPSVALNAQLELQSAGGVRTVPVEEFVTGPGRTTKQPDEILARIIFPKNPEKTGSSFYKVANRKALEISVVNVASVVSIDASGKVSAARIAMGAVAPKPILAPKAASSLIGQKPTGKLFEKAGEIAASECKPISDHRGTKPYRVDMVGVLVKRTLSNAVELK